MLKFKTKTQENIFKKIDKILILDESMITINKFNDILINVNILNTEGTDFIEFLKKYVDNKKVFYNKNRKLISIC